MLKYLLDTNIVIYVIKRAADRGDGCLQRERQPHGDFRNHAESVPGLLTENWVDSVG